MSIETSSFIEVAVYGFGYVAQPLIAVGISIVYIQGPRGLHQKLHKSVIYLIDLFYFNY